MARLQSLDLSALLKERRERAAKNLTWQRQQKSALESKVAAGTNSRTDSKDLETLEPIHGASSSKFNARNLA